LLLKSTYYIFPQAIVNLAEHHGKEAGITKAYRDYVGELVDKDVS
jgi:hypothetical protein